MDIKKVTVSALVIVAFVGYIAWSHHDEVPAAVTARTSGSTTTTSAPSETTNPSSSSASTDTTSTANPSSGTYKDGTYTGSAADAFYGNIQVQTTISGGKITDVVFLQYPNDRHDSVEINSQAMPILKQEAIQAQSAHVNGVSGATDTSQAFVESLSSALAKAV